MNDTDADVEYSTEDVGFGKDGYVLVIMVVMVPK